MKEAWHILVVDDEEDMHSITQLVLKNKSWQGRKFNIVGARSAEEAKKVLDAPESPLFDAAIIDVVMETNEAGLELCKYIRSTQPQNLRIVLRTGQPGMAPEEKVLTDYDIDTYLAKPEATDARLYASVRTALRSSMDVSTLLTVAEQLKALVDALQNTKGTKQLMGILEKSIRFLEAKYMCKAVFFSDVDSGPVSACPELSPTATDVDFDHSALCDALQQIHDGSGGKFDEVPGERYGMAKTSYFLPSLVFEGIGGIKFDESKRSFWWRLGKVLGNVPAYVVDKRLAAKANPKSVRGGAFVQFDQKIFSEKLRDDFFRDFGLLIENWQIAYGMSCALSDFARAQLAEKGK